MSKKNVNPRADSFVQLVVHKPDSRTGLAILSAEVDGKICVKFNDTGLKWVNASDIMLASDYVAENDQG